MIISDTLKRASLILTMATAAGVVFNASRQVPLPWVRATARQVSWRTVTLAEFEKKYEQGSSIVDVRPPQVFVAGHFPSAVNIPAFRTEDYFQTIINSIPSRGRIVLYGADAADPDVERVADFLITSGFQPEQLFVFRPGWKKLGARAENQGHQAGR